MNVVDIDDFDWLINVGPSDIPGTGPTVDHTTGTSEGTYLYIRGTSPAVEGWRARLYSEPLIDSRPGCLSFWFHHYGSVCFVINHSNSLILNNFFLFFLKGIGNLSVSVEDVQTKKSSMIWLTRGALGIKINFQ